MRRGFRGGRRRRAAGVLLAGSGSSRLSLCEVAGAALADEAGGSEADELGLGVDLALAGGVCEGAAGLGDGLLKAVDLHACVSAGPSVCLPSLCSSRLRFNLQRNQAGR